MVRGRTFRATILHRRTNLQNSNLHNRSTIRKNRRQITIRRVTMTNRLFSTISTTITLSFSNRILTITIGHRSISQSSNYQMFTTRRLHTFTSTFSLFNRMLLRVIFSTILSRTQVLTRIMQFIQVSILRHRFRRIIQFINQHTSRLLQRFDVGIIVNIIKNSIPSTT